MPLMAYAFHISSVNDNRDNTFCCMRALHKALPQMPEGIKLVIGEKPIRKTGAHSIDRATEFKHRLVWTGFIPDDVMVDAYRSAEL